MTILESAQGVRADWLQRTGAGILRWSLVFLLEEGLPYQTLIASLLHKYAAGLLREA